MVGNTDALKIVRLSPLMVHTAGKPEIGIGLIDGPVVADHPGLVRESIREIGIIRSGTCVQHAHPACIHGTFIAGILTARRGSGAPAICPNCTLYSHAIFTDRTMGGPLSATPRDLGMAILNCIAVGARVLNISAAVSGMVASGRQFLTGALDYAATHGVIVVVAAGNDRTIGSSILTRHPWVIPVVGAAWVPRRGRVRRGRASASRRSVHRSWPPLRTTAGSGRSRAAAGQRHVLLWK